MSTRGTPDDRRVRLDGWVVRVADPLLTGIGRHWLLLVNGLVILFLLLGLAVPFLRAAGLDGPADALYGLYGGVCHQWAYRSFFVLGPQAVYPRSGLEAAGLDPHGFVGNAALGWKLAYCERDLAIFVGLLVFGVLYAARWRPLGLRPAGYLVYGLLSLPIAADGLSQLGGGRESTWELRLATGLLFGLASAWLLYPRFHASLTRPPYPAPGTP